MATKAFVMNETSKFKKRVTIKEVAAAAGVSPMTVSNVVNGRFKFVSDATRKVVEKEISRLNYRVQESGRGLRVSHRRAAGILIIDETKSFLSDHFNSHVVAGLSNSLSLSGYTLTVQGISLEHFGQSHVMHNLSVDGLYVILSGSRDKREKVIEELRRLDQPIILLQETYRPIDSNICVIRQDDRLGGQMLADHLAARRRERFVIIKPQTDWPAIEARVDSFCTQIRKLNPTANITILNSPDESFDAVQTTLAEHLANSPRPDAVFGANDRLAIGAMLMLQSQEIAIPDEISVVGFNGFESRRYARPLITTVISPAYALGEIAGKVMIERFIKGSFEQNEIVLPVYLEPGETT